MDLLISLGVNSSLGVQLVIFMVTFFAMKHLLFEPYFHAYNERNARTVGQTEAAERYVFETKELEERFSAKATEINEKYRAVYDKTRSDAAKEYDRVVNEARARAKTVIDDSRGKIQAEMEKARTQLAQEIGGVSQLINQKLIGKELTT